MGDRCDAGTIENLNNPVTLQLALDSARFEFTLKMRLNRIMTEIPNICYIFEKRPGMSNMYLLDIRLDTI